MDLVVDEEGVALKGPNLVGGVLALTVCRGHDGQEGMFLE